MTRALLVLFLLSGYSSIAQYDYSAQLKSVGGGHCLPTVLEVSSLHAMSTIVWYKDGQVVATTNGTNSFGQLPRVVAGGHGFGSAANQVTPWGLSVDSIRNLYVSDLGNARVQKWAPGAIAGVTVAGGNGSGSGLNQLGSTTRGIDVDGSGNIYIADEENDRILLWRAGATTGVSVAGGHGQGNATNQLHSPFGLTHSRSGDLYIGDEFNNRVVRWTPGAAAGVVSVNKASAWSTAFDGAGNLYVQAGDGSVTEFAPGATSGTGLGPIPPGVTAMYVDYAGDVFVVDGIDGMIREWAHGSGAWVTIIDTHFQVTSTVFTSQYQGICLDVRGNVYAGDGSYARVLEFDRSVTIDSTYTPTAAGVYQAMVIDILGEPTMTGTFTVNAASPGAPASATVAITASDTVVCAGGTVKFLAAVTNAPAVAEYAWLVNGQFSGATGAVYTDEPTAGRQEVYCLVTDDGSCAVAQSNSIFVTVSDSCQTGGGATAAAHAPLRLPGAFTPNGDGHNDVLYVPGGPAGSIVREFAVFSRWGECVFRVHDVPPGDPAFGWDGKVHGKPVSPDTYVYLVVMGLPGGGRQNYKGTVVLIR